MSAPKATSDKSAFCVPSTDGQPSRVALSMLQQAWPKHTGVGHSSGITEKVRLRLAWGKRDGEGWW